MKKLFVCLFLAIFLQSFSQEKKELYVKANALFLPVGILNAGLEYQLSEHYTMQGDVFISPWKSFAGHELQIYSTSLEGRYYFDQSFKHWYIGANLGVSAYRLQKWNYWKHAIYLNENNVPYENSDLYQKGFSFFVGATVGYQFQLAEKWNMDIYGTFGNSQDLYKGYNRTTGMRYDVAKNYNKSGEFIPYRGGVMISYKLN